MLHEAGFTPESAIKTAENPFSAANSGYGIIQNGALVSSYPVDSPMHAFHTEAHKAFRSFVQQEPFPCLGGKSVLASDRYVFSAYPDLTSVEVAEGLCHDLKQFTDVFRRSDKPNGRVVPLQSFVAVFAGPQATDEISGVTDFYRFLRNVADVNSAKGVPWAEGKSSDIEDPNYDFSSGGESFVPIFLRPETTNPDRLFGYTTVVFNPREGFEALKAHGAYDSLHNTIISRVKAPYTHNLINFGDQSIFPAAANVPPELENLEREARKELGKCPFDHGKPA